jgi:hypothetical protein
MSQSQPLSAVLAEIAAHDRPAITVAELTQMFGGRALGALLFVFGIACFLPLPPGATTIFGAPLLVLAPQLVIGASAPWLPRRVKAQTIATEDLRAGLPRIIVWLQRIEAISRPRLVVLFSPLGERVIGLVCTLLALVLILPIPLGNMLPAATVSVFSLAMIQRDGVLALAGHAFAAASVGVLLLAAHVVGAMVRHALSALPIS